MCIRMFTHCRSKHGLDLDKLSQETSNFLAYLYAMNGIVSITTKPNYSSISVRENLKDLTKQYDKSENDLKALQSVGQVQRIFELLIKKFKGD